MKKPFVKMRMQPTQNIRLEPDLYAYIRRVKEETGESITKQVNTLIRTKMENTHEPHNQARHLVPYYQHCKE